jgi:hypothetical protein
MAFAKYLYIFALGNRFAHFYRHAKNNWQQHLNTFKKLLTITLVLIVDKKFNKITEVA